MIPALLISIAVAVGTLTFGICVSALVLHRIRDGMTHDQRETAQAFAALAVLGATLAATIATFTIAYF